MDLNEQQLDAVLNTYDKNTALIAGAGSGKTRTITARVQYLIEEMNINPKNIMAITFTNKAANEMEQRIKKQVKCKGLWIGTFHSICVKIIKKHGEWLDISKNFNILDEADAKVIIRKILIEQGVQVDKRTPKAYLNAISKLKSNYISPNKAIKQAYTEYDKSLANVYKEYCRKCKRSQNLDFDDLLIYAMKLLDIDEVSEWFRKNIKYLLIDEFQDSNYVQILFTKKLIQDNNLFVVGDDKQSIYGFRGAKPKYLEYFEEEFENSKMMFLEKNYRSTQMIVNASNDVISKNKSKINCLATTDNEIGDPVTIKECIDPVDEARFVVNEISKIYDKTNDYDEIAILYAKNELSAVIEKELLSNEIPYQMVKGTSFFARAEIKDTVSFLKFINNPCDDTSFTRAMKTFKGVGDKTVKKIIEFADKHEIDYLTACEMAIDEDKPKGRTLLKRIKEISKFKYVFIYELIEKIYKETDILNKYEINSKMDEVTINENTSKIENLKEFINIASQIQNEDQCDLNEFLERISLLTTDTKSKNGVKLMTMHSAKGLEYDNVFIIGCEENIIPHKDSVSQEDIEEQRRLMYVAMTRPRKKLYITHCNIRYFGKTGISTQYSRFLPEIKPDKYVYI